MLTGADIIAAKLLVQLGDVPAKVVREHLLAGDAEADTSIDLVNRLASAGAVDATSYRRVRRYTAMFEFVRHQAVCLRRLERHGKAKDAVYDLLARMEYGRYKRRLSAMMVEMGEMLVSEAKKLEHDANRIIHKEDLRVLSRYRAKGFKGIKRPLLPNPVTGKSFRIAALFRTDRTIEHVNLAIQRLQADEHGKSQPPLASLDPESVSAMELEAVWGEDVNADADADADADAPARDEEDTREGKIIRKGAWAETGGNAEDDEATRSRFEHARFQQEPARRGTKALTQIGPYRVVEELGQGGAGDVYVAQRNGTGPMVALKVLRLPADEDDEARFEREANISGILDNPYTISLLDRGLSDNGMRYMALPLFTGETLKQVIASKPDAVRTFRYLEQLLLGVAAVHSANVVHRDLKPSNIIVQSGKDTIKIVDFGLARFIKANRSNKDEFRTMAGAISGSPAYVAPETICGDHGGAPTDVYSLGIVFFELLTGKRPLTAPTAYSYLKEHLIATPLCLRQAQPGLDWDTELERLIARMLAKHPDDRPTCREILDAFQGGLRERSLECLATPVKPGDLTPDVTNPFYGPQRA
jgi:hypothetical protein